MMTPKPENHICLHEDDFKQLAITVVKIDSKIDLLSTQVNGKIQKFTDHLDTAGKWRIALVGTILSLIVSGLGWAYAYGMLSQQVKVNTERWNRILEKHPVEV
jgi:hypothetical protein